MSKKTYVLRDGKLIEKHLAQPLQNNSGPFIQGDIAPYQSMIDGSVISSRSQHRELLKRHGCIEVGNETKYLKPKAVQPPPGLKETLIREVKKHRGY